MRDFIKFVACLLLMLGYMHLYCHEFVTAIALFILSLPAWAYLLIRRNV